MGDDVAEEERGLSAAPTANVLEPMVRTFTVRPPAAAVPTTESSSPERFAISAE